MKRVIAGILVLVSLPAVVLAGLDSRRALYIGGTIAGLAEGTECILSTQSEDALMFTPQKKGRQSLSIPYASITALEYGQKAGRRVAMAVLVSPWALFSKKRKHYLTITFTDAAGKEQAGVFELGKKIVRTTLTIVEVRSGKQIEYQDEEARKASRGGDK